MQGRWDRQVTQLPPRTLFWRLGKGGETGAVRERAAGTEKGVWRD